MKKLEDAPSDEAAMHAPLHEIERMLEAQGREMLRAMMQAHFDLRSAQGRPVEVRDVDGVARAKVRRGSRNVETKFGEVELNRNLYQAPDTDALVPLDAGLELPDEKYVRDRSRPLLDREHGRDLCHPLAVRLLTLGQPSLEASRRRYRGLARRVAQIAMQRRVALAVDAQDHHRRRPLP